MCCFHPTIAQYNILYVEANPFYSVIFNMKVNWTNKKFKNLKKRILFGAPINFFDILI